MVHIPCPERDIDTSYETNTDAVLESNEGKSKQGLEVRETRVAIGPRSRTCTYHPKSLIYRSRTTRIAILSLSLSSLSERNVATHTLANRTVCARHRIVSMHAARVHLCTRGPRPALHLSKRTRTRGGEPRSWPAPTFTYISSGEWNAPVPARRGPLPPRFELRIYLPERTLWYSDRCLHVLTPAVSSRFNVHGPLSVKRMVKFAGTVLRHQSCSLILPLSRRTSRVYAAFPITTRKYDRGRRGRGIRVRRIRHPRFR